MKVSTDVVDGVVWVVKTASAPDERTRLEHERAQLRKAAHPGVVEVGPPTDSTAAELRTRHAGWPLSDTGPLPAAEVCGLGAAVATVLADLHDVGIVHGALDANHILIGADGRPMLCGFGRSTSTIEGDAAADVEALAATLAAHLGPDAPRRLLRALEGRGRTRRPPPSARALAAALGQAMPGRLPSPAADLSGLGPGPAVDGPLAPVGSHRDADPPLIAAIRGRVPGSTRDRKPAWSRSRHGVEAGVESSPARPRSPARRRHHLETGVVIVAVVALIAAVGAIVERSGPSRRAAACPPADRGCRPVRVQDGSFVTPSGTFAIALSDPVVVLGRWGCGGDSLPAALDPRTGQVWAWLRWAGPGRAVTAHAVTTRSGATSLRVAPTASGCDHLVVIEGARAVTIRLPGEAAR